jgi:hypothetical protein
MSAAWDRVALDIVRRDAALSVIVTVGDAQVAMRFPDDRAAWPTVRVTHTEPDSLAEPGPPPSLEGL